MAAAGGALFCGSIVLPDDHQHGKKNNDDIEKVFRTVCSALPRRLARLPDGEVSRFFALWQLPVFLKTPWTCSKFALEVAGALGVVEPPAAIPDAGNMEDVVLAETNYDTHAMQSYLIFKKLKKEGVIDSETRFQVCLPTPMNIVAICVRQELKKYIEPMYEALTVKALRNIQAQIPHDELAIQWDCPMEVLFLEGAIQPFEPYFELNITSIVERLAKLSAFIDRDVELGFHLCYGDLYHRHFVEPKDSALMVNLANHISSAVHRPINWIHMPVPIDRKDEAYFKPLTALQLGLETELYLGLVHANDRNGTKERVAAAKRVVPGLRFGIATECGLGRTPTSDVASIFETMREVSTPVLAVSPFTALATSMKQMPLAEERNSGVVESIWQGTFW